jgi:LysM repeat protein
MMTDPGVFWYMGTATNDEGGARRGGGGGQTTQQWHGSTENRSAINPASVDGKIVDGKYYEFPEGTTWRTDLASMAQTQSSIAATNTSLTQTDADMAKYRANFAKDPLGANGAKLNANNIKAEPAPPAPEAPEVSANAANASRKADQSISAQAQNGALSTQFPASPTQTAPAADAYTPKIARVKELVKSYIKESFVFKSSIGRTLLELDYNPAEVGKNAQQPLWTYRKELDPLWTELTDAVKSGKITGPQATEITNLTAAVEAFQKANPVPLETTQANVLNTIAPGAVTGVNAQGQNVTMPDGTNPETGKPTELTQPAPAPAQPAPAPAVAKLAADNNIADANVITPGQKITMPDGSIYTVVLGDTLTAIQAGKGKGKYEKPQSSQEKAPPKSVTQVSPSGQNLAGTKTKNTDDITRAMELLALHNSGKEKLSARDLDYFTKMVANSNAQSDAAAGQNSAGQPGGSNLPGADQARPGLDPKKGKPEVYDRQKQLAALGAKGKDGQILKTDGVRGDDTIAAEKEFGSMIIDPKTNITVNGAVRVVNPADIKSIQSWIKAVKEKRKKMEEVPPVYMDIVKKQSAIKESTGYTNDELSRIVSLVHHR